MRGRITWISGYQHEGEVLAEDGRKFLFGLSDLPKSGRGNVGDPVEFDLEDGFAVRLVALDRRPRLLPWLLLTVLIGGIGAAIWRFVLV